MKSRLTSSVLVFAGVLVVAGSWLSSHRTSTAFEFQRDSRSQSSRGTKLWQGVSLSHSDETLNVIVGKR